MRTMEWPWQVIRVMKRARATMQWSSCQCTGVMPIIGRNKTCSRNSQGDHPSNRSDRMQSKRRTCLLAVHRMGSPPRTASLEATGLFNSMIKGTIMTSMTFIGIHCSLLICPKISLLMANFIPFHQVITFLNLICHTFHNHSREGSAPSGHPLLGRPSVPSNQIPMKLWSWEENRVKIMTISLK